MKHIPGELITVCDQFYRVRVRWILASNNNSVVGLPTFRLVVGGEVRGIHLGSDV